METDFARPLLPTTLDRTLASLTLQSSSSFWIRGVCCAVSRTRCLRVRVRSRTSWMGSYRSSCCFGGNAPTSPRATARLLAIEGEGARGRAG